MDRFTRIYIMMILYGITLLFDFVLTNIHVVRTGHLWMEANPICVYFIEMLGQPYNLLIPFFIVASILSFERVQSKINKSYPAFLAFYFVLLIFIVAHVRGIISWTIG